MSAKKEINYNEPVAYDKDGNPLYAHPPVKVEASSHTRTSTDTTKIANNIENLTQDELARKHTDSLTRYPGLNLSESEYVILAVYRHWIGLVSTISVGIVVTMLVGAAWIYLPSISNGYVSVGQLFIPMLLILIVVWIATYLAAWVYLNNKFYLTNESVIENIQTSIFNNREQTVGLQNVEDVSYAKEGIMQYIFNYGSIRMSTMGDETTYRFKYVANPKEQAAKLNNSVESFKAIHQGNH